MMKGSNAKSQGGVLRLAAALLVLLMGCRQEPTRWYLDVAVPIFDDEWGWEDFLPDSSAEIAVGNPGVLFFQGQIAALQLESLSHLPDTVVENILTPAFSGGPFEVPPGAVLLDDDQDIVFAGMEQEFRSLVLESGILEYRVESSANGYVQLRYDFPGILVGGAPVALDVVVPPALGGANEAVSGQLDLALAQIDLSGQSGLESNRIHSNLMIGTPDDIDYTAQIYGNDTIKVHLEFKGMEVREILGYFGQETLELNEQVSVFDPERWPAGAVTGAPTKAALTFHNTMGADLSCWIESFHLDGVALDHPSFSMEQVISRANWSESPVVFDTWEWDLLECTPSLFASLGQFPETIGLSGGLQLNPLGDVTAGNDYFRVAQPPFVTLDFELPLSFGLDGLLIRDTVWLEPRDLPGFEGQFVVELRHDFPVEMAVSATYVSFGASGAGAFESTIPALSESWVENLPVQTAHLAAGGYIAFEIQIDSDGQVPFSGSERMHVHVALDGRYEAVLE